MASGEEEIDRLDGLSTFELRNQWRRLWKQPPPMRLRGDLLIRGLAWKLQEAAFGGIGKAEKRALAAYAKAELEAREQQLERDAGSASASNGKHGYSSSTETANSDAGYGKRAGVRFAALSAPAFILREDNRLVREWNGTTHKVLVLASCFEWQVRQYRSLSQIAEAITR